MALDSTLYLLFAQAITSGGEISGIGMTSTGEQHAFLATPITDGNESVFTAETNETNKSGRVIPPSEISALWFSADRSSAYRA